MGRYCQRNVERGTYIGCVLVIGLGALATPSDHALFTSSSSSEVT